MYYVSCRYFFTLILIVLYQGFVIMAHNGPGIDAVKSDGWVEIGSGSVKHIATVKQSEFQAIGIALYSLSPQKYEN